MLTQDASDGPKWPQRAFHDFQAACADDTPFRAAYVAGLWTATTPTPTSTTMPTPAAMPTPTMGLGPAATEVVTSPATEASVAERDGDDGIKDAVQWVFDTWTRALVESDAALFHSVLTRELAGYCGLEELQSWVDESEGFLGEVEVRSVFVDVSDPSRSFAEILIKQSGGRPEQSLTYPRPVALEDGKWRAGVATFLVGRPSGSCPFVASGPRSGLEGREPEFPQILGLDLDRHEDILAAVPRTRVVHGSIMTGNSSNGFSTGGTMSAYDNQVNIYAQQEADPAAAELVRLYRDGLKHSSWDIIGEGSTGDFGWFSWTVLDGEGLLWYGKLVVAPSYEGWKQVWLSLYSDDSDDGQ